MNRIYGIFTGLNCLGFFTEESEAKEYCTVNSNVYIAPLKNMQNQDDLDQVIPKCPFQNTDELCCFHREPELRMEDFRKISEGRAKRLTDAVKRPYYSGLSLYTIQQLEEELQQRKSTI